jgi:hypothetical protein
MWTAPRLEAVKKLGMVPVEVSHSRLAVRLAQPDPVRGRRGCIRGTDAERRFDQLKAQVPDAWPNFSASRDSCRRWISCRPTGSGAKWRRRWRVCFQVDLLLVPSLARRDAGHHQLHGAPVAHAARRLRRSGRGAQRLGAGPGAPAAEILAAAPRAAWRHADRPAV